MKPMSIAMLVLFVLVPGTFAHYDAGVDGVFGDVDDDSNANRVSGLYLGSANPRLTVHGFGSGGYVALCDMEVNFPGGLDNDEEFVDGSKAGPGTLADNVNDGGSGSVCHTPEGFYDAVEGGAYDYDTGGCGYGPAFGEDAVSSVLWGSASCDDETPGSGGGPVNHVLTLSLCTVTSLRASDPIGDAEGLVTAEAECLDNFVECANEVLNDVTGGRVPAVDALGNGLEMATDDLLDPLSGDSPSTECPTGAASCGADGVPDRANFGELSTGVPFPTSVCDAYGSAAVFVWDAVVGESLSAPTYGWII